MTPGGPVQFIFGLHVHQPVGNFDHVFEEHARDVYLPFLTRLEERDCLPVIMHISGPLLEWLEAHGSPYLDLVGRLVADGRIELLLSGMYEPVLAVLPRRDRVEQIEWMRDAIRARFGVDPTGLWLTERVWEPDLPHDLAAAGIEYALVDDRHFLVSGFRTDQLVTHFHTEAAGRRLALFSISERLRYLVPFRPVEELEQHFTDLHSAGRSLAVLVDDGEKFGGWPGTRQWVYDDGWLARFFDAMDRLRENDIVRLTTCRAALRSVPGGGLAYLQTASYREMEAWALPADQARRLKAFEADVGDAKLAGPDGAFVRGGHWRNFMVKYPEANRAHKHMLALSALSRERADPAAARRAIGRAQCNDAYWHGIFGGLYLPHLRAAIWAQLAHAEGILRRGEHLQAEAIDIDADGEPEIWIHSARFSAVVAPHRGAGIECYSVFDLGRNYADTLTRRDEAYHTALGGATEAAPLTPAEPDQAGGMPSIHEMERTRTATNVLPFDRETRALFLERLVAPDVDEAAFSSGRYPSLERWSNARFAHAIERSPRSVVVRCTAAGLEKRLEFTDDGSLTVTFRLTKQEIPPGSRFTTEVSVAHPVRTDASPAAQRWTYAIETVAQSDRGIERTRQGESVVLLWDGSQDLAGEMQVRVLGLAGDLANDVGR